MIRILSDILAVLCAGPVVNSLVRIVLAARSARPPSEVQGTAPSRWLVLIPARNEGALVEASLHSIAQARRQGNAEVLVLLDGPDPVAAEITRSMGFNSIVKEPPGPTKAAALAWFARNHSALLMDYGALLLLDVGSTLSPSFFDDFRWPVGADAVQCFLSGRGSGAGRAAAASENFAQHREDVGRQRLGWNVQLRGTGTAFKPPVFIEMVPRLSTQVEDLESSLLLTADGKTLRMAPAAAAVHDEKPRETRDATQQRSRWLAGQIEMLIRHWRSFARVIGRRPFEGIAFLSEMFARPLSLTVPLRLLAAALLAWAGTPIRLLVALFLLATAIADILYMRTATYFGWKESLTLGAAWMRAIAGVPRAFLQWRKARKS